MAMLAARGLFGVVFHLLEDTKEAASDDAFSNLGPADERPCVGLDLINNLFGISSSKILFGRGYRRLNLFPRRGPWFDDSDILVA